MININDDEFILMTETAYSEETGLPLRQETRTPTGLLHAPPNGDPSVVRFVDGQPRTMIWHERGVEHRENGPSSVTLRPRSCQVMTEMFHIYGEPRPSDAGPFLVRYRENGEVWRCEDADGHVYESIEVAIGPEGLDCG